MTHFCPQCGGKTTMQIQATIQAPSELEHKFTKANLRRSDVSLTGVLWETADYICNDCYHVQGGYGNYVTGLEDRVKELERPRNLNILCKARLTAIGAEMWNRQYANTPKERRPVRIKAGEVLETQLWQFMQVYGAELYNGMPQIRLPFINNEITIGENP